MKWSTPALSETPTMTIFLFEMVIKNGTFKPDAVKASFGEAVDHIQKTADEVGETIRWTTLKLGHSRHIEGDAETFSLTVEAFRD